MAAQTSPVLQSTWLGTESWQPTAATFQLGVLFVAAGFATTGRHEPPVAGAGLMLTVSAAKPSQMSVP